MENKKIGGGWQCDVYEYPGNRVLKTPKKLLPQIWKIIKTAGPFALIKNPIPGLNADWEYSLKGLKEVLMREDFPSALLGNPKIDYDTLSYTQDMVIPLSEYLLKAQFEDKRNILEQYPVLIKKLWQFGISEKIFNFTLNTGVTYTGELILTDLGELDFDRERILSDIRTKRWLRSYSYFSMKDKDLQLLYKDVMATEITADIFEKEWKSKLL